MKLVFTIILAGAGITVAWATFWNFFLFFRRPVEFYRYHHKSFVDKRTLGVVLVIGSWIGLGLCLFHGLTSILFWIPSSWTTSDGTWIGAYFSGLIAFFGSLSLGLKMVEFNNKLVEGLMTRDTLIDEERKRTKRI